MRINRLLAFLVVILLSVPLAGAVPSLDHAGIPQVADAEKPISISVNISSNALVGDVYLAYQRPSDAIASYQLMFLVQGNQTNGTWACEIPVLTWSGTLKCWVVVNDNDGQFILPGSGTIDIVLEGQVPEKEFPWGIVLMAVFLVLVLIVTELIFKPGIYRPTGREKARALEEEDRMREMEGQDRPDEEN